MISGAWLIHRALTKLYTGMLVALAKGMYGVAASFVSSDVLTVVDCVPGQMN